MVPGKLVPRDTKRHQRLLAKRTTSQLEHGNMARDEPKILSQQIVKVFGSIPHKTRSRLVAFNSSFSQTGHHKCYRRHGQCRTLFAAVECFPDWQPTWGQASLLNRLARGGQHHSD